MGREAARRDHQTSKVRRRGVEVARCEVTSPLSKEFEAAEIEIRSMNLGNYCAVLRF